MAIEWRRETSQKMSSSTAASRMLPSYVSITSSARTKGKYAGMMTVSNSNRMVQKIMLQYE